jgi:hypothetical protein
LVVDLEEREDEPEGGGVPERSLRVSHGVFSRTDDMGAMANELHEDRRGQKKGKSARRDQDEGRDARPYDCMRGERRAA